MKNFALIAALFSLVLGAAIVVTGQDKSANPPQQQPKAVTNDEFVSLFDGETLRGWEGDPKLWSVEDGAITGQTTDEDPIAYNSFLTWANGELDDFELMAEYRIRNGNSGIQIRSFERDPEKPYSIGGYQADIDAEKNWAGTNYGEGFRGILAKRGQIVTIDEEGKPQVTGSLGDPGVLAEKITDDWNEFHIIAQGNRILCKINGQLMSDLTDEDTDTRQRKGLLAFQLHRGPAMKVQFRNIRLKRLPLGDLKKIVYVAGPPSHGPRQHEHNAGCLLAARLLNENMGDKVLATAYLNGWPNDPSAFQNADAVIVHSDGGAKHPAYWHLRQIDYLRKQGVGIGMVHYAVEMTPGEPNDALIAATGGAFEVNYSVNPHWDGDFSKFPQHPVANGVKPFKIHDEWYFNMRFIKDMKGVAPILSSIPPDDTMARQDGAHSGNPDVRKMVAERQRQHLCWVIEREDGGRGFGFTGLHFHDNWADENFRKTLLNAACWTAGVEVPPEGVSTPALTQEDLDANLDPKSGGKPKAKKAGTTKNPEKPSKEKKTAA